MHALATLYATLPGHLELRPQIHLDLERRQERRLLLKLLREGDMVRGRRLMVLGKVLAAHGGGAAWKWARHRHLVARALMLCKVLARHLTAATLARPRQHADGCLGDAVANGGPAEAYAARGAFAARGATALAMRRQALRTKYVAVRALVDGFLGNVEAQRAGEIGHLRAGQGRGHGCSVAVGASGLCRVGVGAGRRIA